MIYKNLYLIIINVRKRNLIFKRFKISGNKPKLSNNKIDLKLSIFLLLIISSTFIHIN